jgi:hypothetical protein
VGAVRYDAHFGFESRESQRRFQGYFFCFFYLESFSVVSKGLVWFGFSFGHLESLGVASKALGFFKQKKNARCILRVYASFQISKG